MALTSKTRTRIAAAVVFAGLAAGAGTIASFAQHETRPAVGMGLRSDDTVSIDSDRLDSRVILTDAEDEERGFALLKRMLDADARVTIEGDQTTTLYTGRNPVVSEQHILRDGSRGLRMVYTAPPRMAETVVVDDGETLWKYDKQRNRLETSPSRLKRRLARYPVIMRSHRSRLLSVSIVGNDRVAGRTCTIIKVQRLKDPGPTRTFWVDDSTGVQLKVEIHERSGALRSVTQYTSVSFNVPVPDGAFDRPATRPGVRVEEAAGGDSANSLQSAAGEAGFKLLSPTYLPSGYQFQSAQVTRFEGKKMVHARYMNGLNTLSIFQTPQSGPDSGVSFPKKGVATMVTSGHTVVVVANIKQEELERVIQSMRP